MGEMAIDGEYDPENYSVHKIEKTLIWKHFSNYYFYFVREKKAVAVDLLFSLLLFRCFISVFREGPEREEGGAKNPISQPLFSRFSKSQSQIYSQLWALRKLLYYGHPGISDKG